MNSKDLYQEFITLAQQNLDKADSYEDQGSVDSLELRKFKLSKAKFHSDLAKSYTKLAKELREGGLS